MKRIQIVFVALFALALASTVASHAQTPAKHEATSVSALTPEEMAKDALAKWKATLNLTDQQVPGFEAVMTDSYRKMQAAKTAAAGDKAKMQASMQTIMKDRDTALSKVLTPEQMDTYRVKLAQATARARGHNAPVKKKEGTAK
jgi:Spy/CpxP family protein refolding chaperone